MTDNVEYKEEIISSVLKVANETEKTVSYKELVKEMQDFIIRKFDNQNLNAYKGEWKRKLKQLVKYLGYKLVDFDDVSWVTINEKMQEKKTVSSSSTKTSDNNNYSLSSEEKKRVVNIFDSIEEHDKWLLSTGTNIQDKMKELVTI
ncbi:hypothetical protein INT48_000238 [Thamnidium elegans]|uniref:Uncharacterized protein n=1 Tax=Thamnidium elegans TaxID=101142 RepID=A0A8H7VUH4_9FUNG|nr:hypothetical protein INT48_000238 [Thamnidium elegans]